MEAVRSALGPARSDSLAEDLCPLTQALGSPAHLACFSSFADLVQVSAPRNVQDLASLVQRFQDQLLFPLELPAIRDAYHHASRGEGRELIQLDRTIASRYGSGAFAEASRHVGRVQLRRLRPLRDRTLQKYLTAVEQGEAPGMHVVVFGVLLSLFSLPLRQGLQHYAERTHESLLESASIGVRLADPERTKLQDLSRIPAAEAIRTLVEFRPTV